jgi:ribosome-associated protein
MQSSRSRNLVPESVKGYTSDEEETSMIRITDELAIPDEEVSFTTSRSGGPGGQNVNKLETRVTLRFDLAGSAVLSEEQKARLRERLATRITRAGVLHVTAQKHRTQAANRDAAVERFAELVREAFQEETPRKKTRPSRAAKARRVEEKRRQSQRKRERSAPVRWE